MCGNENVDDKMSQLYIVFGHTDVASCWHNPSIYISSLYKGENNSV